MSKHKIAVILIALAVAFGAGFAISSSVWASGPVTQVGIITRESSLITTAGIMAVASVGLIAAVMGVMAFLRRH
ncbi:hypothetical protein IKG60_00690 [Candidatus Saccharibacteria bacterium]|nr:hypothetical protein [Candidatus Saccharibacteria bacterium]